VISEISALSVPSHRKKLGPISIESSPRRSHRRPRSVIAQALWRPYSATFIAQKFSASAGAFAFAQA